MFSAAGTPRLFCWRDSCLDIFDLLNFLCGLAFFLFGMFYMGDGLESCAGGRLQSILEKLTARERKKLDLFI